MRYRNSLVLSSLFILLSAASSGLAQNQLCKVIDARPEDGKYLIEIDGKKLIAITQEKAAEYQKLKVDLDEARKKLADSENMKAVYEKVVESYRKNATDAKEYIDSLEDLVQGYKNLAKDYKKMKEPWVTVEAGVGATSGDTEPAVMLGIGIRSFRVWGFFQEKNSGALVGLSLPLF